MKDPLFHYVDLSENNSNNLNFGISDFTKQAFTNESEQIFIQQSDIETNAAGGNDYILGSSGKDTIYGWDGDDQIFGNEGDDIFISGKAMII